MGLALVSPILVFLIFITWIRIYRYRSGLIQHSPEVDFVVILIYQLLVGCILLYSENYTNGTIHTIYGLVILYMFLYIRFSVNKSEKSGSGGSDHFEEKYEVERRKVKQVKSDLNTKDKELRNLASQLENAVMVTQQLERELEELKLTLIVEPSIEEIEDQMDAMQGEPSHKKEIDPIVEDHSESKLFLDEESHDFIDFTDEINVGLVSTGGSASGIKQGDRSLY